jgi:hypothetical protein
VAFFSIQAIDRMNSIPPFDDDLGYLPPGVYEATWAEFSQRFGINRHRLHLLTGIKAACRKLAMIELKLGKKTLAKIKRSCRHCVSRILQVLV